MVGATACYNSPTLLRAVKITKATVAWADLLPSVVRAVEEWQPGTLTSERGYRDSLVEHLRQCAPDARLETEYRDHGTTADIYLKWQGIISTGELYIEIKKDLRSKSEFDRLLGQIETLNPLERQLILVLCGDTKLDFVDRLRERYSAHLYGGSLIIMDLGRLAILVKTPSTT